MWPNQRLIKNNKLLRAQNLNDNSERLVDSTEFIQRHSLLIPQAFNICQRFSPTYTSNIATTKKKEKKKKKQEQTRTSTLANYQVNLIVSIFQPTA